MDVCLIAEYKMALHRNFSKSRAWVPFIYVLQLLSRELFELLYFDIVIWVTYCKV